MLLEILLPAHLHPQIQADTPGEDIHQHTLAQGWHVIQAVSARIFVGRAVNLRRGILISLALLKAFTSTMGKN